MARWWIRPHPRVRAGVGAAAGAEVVDPDARRFGCRDRAQQRPLVVADGLGHTTIRDVASVDVTVGAQQHRDGGPPGALIERDSLEQSAREAVDLQLTAEIGIEPEHGPGTDDTEDPLRGNAEPVRHAVGSGREIEEHAVEIAGGVGSFERRIDRVARSEFEVLDRVRDAIEARRVRPLGDVPLDYGEGADGM